MHTAMTIKICGITRVEDALVALSAGADHLGLILAPSKRRLSLDAATAIAQAVGDPARVVVLVMDQPIDDVVTWTTAIGAGCVQLHGAESASAIAELTQRLPETRIIRAWPVTGSRNWEDLRAHLDETHAAGGRIDVLILDAPKGGAHPGYDALAEVARQVRPAVPAIWCAGGLRPDNLEEAVPPGVYDGVDVASGVETSPGIKSAGLVQRFIAVARGLFPAGGDVAGA